MRIVGNSFLHLAYGESRSAGLPRYASLKHCLNIEACTVCIRVHINITEDSIKILITCKGISCIRVAGGGSIGGKLCLLGPENNRFRIEYKTVILRAVYLIEKLHRFNKIAYRGEGYIIEHSKIALALVHTAQHLRYIVCTIVFNAIILVFRHCIEKFSHLHTGNCLFRSREGVCDIEIIAAHRSVVPRLVCAICEVKAPAVEIGSLRLLLIEGEELLGSALIHHLKPALAIKLLGGIKILPLVACKLSALAITLRKGVSKLRKVALVRDFAFSEEILNIGNNLSRGNVAVIVQAADGAAVLVVKINVKLFLFPAEPFYKACDLLVLRFGRLYNKVDAGGFRSYADIAASHKLNHSIRVGI